MNNSLETLFVAYVENKSNNADELEDKCEKAYDALYKCIEDNTAAVEALDEFQYAAMSASFRAGIKSAFNLIDAIK